MAKNSQVVAPWSKLKETVAKLLVKEGYLEGLEVKDNQLVMKLKKDAFTDVTIVSRPSLRVYAKKDDLPRVLGGQGIAIVSTPAGIMTDKEARKKNMGGEVICKIW